MTDHTIPPPVSEDDMSTIRGTIKHGREYAFEFRLIDAIKAMRDRLAYLESIHANERVPETREKEAR